MSAFPTSITPKEITLTSEQPTFTSFSESGKSQARIAAGHLWNIKAVFPAMTRAQVAPLMAFTDSMRGRYTTFTFIPESHSAPLGVATGTPIVSGSHSVGDLTIATTGWTASQTGIMLAGDILKFDNHTKVYMIALDADSDGSGDSTITLTSPLIEALVDTEALTVSSVPFTMALKDDPLEWKTDRQSHSTYTLELIESL